MLTEAGPVDSLCSNLEGRATKGKTLQGKGAPAPGSRPRMNADDNQDVYIPPAPAFPDLKHAKVDHDRKHRPPGLKLSDTLVMMLAEIALMIVYGLFVENETIPKPKFPDPGPEDIPEMLDLVQPFKRYPPGFDNYVGSAR